MYIVQSKVRQLIKSLGKRAGHTFLQHLDGKIEGYIRAYASAMGGSEKTMSRDEAIAFEQTRKLSM